MKASTRYGTRSKIRKKKKKTRKVFKKAKETEVEELFWPRMKKWKRRRELYRSRPKKTGLEGWDTKQNITEEKKVCQDKFSRSKANQHFYFSYLFHPLLFYLWNRLPVSIVPRSYNLQHFKKGVSGRLSHVIWETF